MSSLQFQLSQKLLSDGGYFRKLKRISVENLFKSLALVLQNGIWNSKNVMEIM
ncbi:21083_t:CDS:2, partial [Entrophospora sp. SA101]